MEYIDKRFDYIRQIYDWIWDNREFIIEKTKKRRRNEESTRAMPANGRLKMIEKNLRT